MPTNETTATPTSAAFNAPPSSTPHDFEVKDDERNPGRVVVSKRTSGGILVAAGCENLPRSIRHAKNSVDDKVDALDHAKAYALESGHIVRPKSVAHITIGWETEEEARKAAESDAARDEARAKRKAAEASQPTSAQSSK